MSITEIKKALRRTFQGILKNIVSLANDSTLEKDYKVLKVGEKNTPIEISEDNVKINNSDVLTKASSLNDLSDVSYSDGDLNISGIDKVESNGDLYIEAGRDLVFNSSRNTACANDFLLLATKKLYFDSGFHTYIEEVSADMLNFKVGDVDLLALKEDATTSALQSSIIFAGCPIQLKDIGGIADTPDSGFGSLYVNGDVLYFKTDGGTVTNLLAGGGGTSRWHTELGGYRTNNTSTTTYYTFYRRWYDNWSNGDSSPTSINVYDSPSVAWIAPADCTITNFRVVGYCNDTGATDPFKFYIYKGTTAHDATSTSLTLVANTDAITCAAALRAFNESKDISSGNSISAGEQLYVFLKKDSNTGNQDLYFNIVMSGEYS